MKEVRVTQFGKLLRVLRVKHEERMLDMAERLDCSPAFLSRMERGSKPIPLVFGERVIEQYGLKGKDAAAMHRAAAESQEEFRLNAFKPLAQDTAALLARRFEHLSDSQLKQIRDVLKKRGDPR